jgi:hypothetical protein
MVDQGDDEDAQDTVERIKDAAGAALEGVRSAIDDAKLEVEVLIDDHESDEAEAISDAVEVLSRAVRDLEDAEDTLERAYRAVRRIGLAVKENEAEDEGGDEGGEENDEEGDEAEPA